MNKQRTADDVWDTILHNVALDEAEDRAPEDARDRQWAEGLAREARAQIERMRHDFLSRTTEKRRLVSKPELRDLDRESLLARLARLLAQAGPSVQLAYRDLSHQSDDDLRLLVTVIEEPSPSAH